MVFAIHWHESAMDLQVLPILNPPPTSVPIPSLWVILRWVSLCCEFVLFMPWRLFSGILDLYSLDADTICPPLCGLWKLKSKHCQVSRWEQNHTNWEPLVQGEGDQHWLTHYYVCVGVTLSLFIISFNFSNNLNGQICFLFLKWSIYDQIH